MIQIPEGYVQNEQGWWVNEKAQKKAYRPVTRTSGYFPERDWWYKEVEGIMVKYNRQFAEMDIDHIDPVTSSATKKMLEGAERLGYFDKDMVRVLRVSKPDNIKFGGGYFDGWQLQQGLKLMGANCEMSVWMLSSGRLVILATRDSVKDKVAAMLMSSASTKKWHEGDADICTLDIDMDELKDVATSSTKASKARKSTSKAKTKPVESKPVASKVEQVASVEASKEVQPVATVKTDDTGKVAGLGWVMWTDDSEQARQDKRARDIVKAKMAVKRARIASRASSKATVKRVAVRGVDARKCAKKQGIFKVWLGKLQGLLGKVAML